MNPLEPPDRLRSVKADRVDHAAGSYIGGDGGEEDGSIEYRKKRRRTYGVTAKMRHGSNVII